MYFGKIRKKICRYVITITLTYGVFKLTQEGVDILNYRQLTEYEDIIDDFVNLMDEEHIEKPIDIFDYYNYALWNGYLSYNHNYQYNGARDIFISNPGLSCIIGEGVCLNNADLLTKIFSTYGYKAYTINCYVDINKEINIESIRTNSLLERKNSSNMATDIIDELMNILSPLTVLTGNHAITCVEYEGKFYYFDPTNLAYLKKTNINMMKVINGTGEYGIRYFPSMFFGNIGVLENIVSNEFDYSELLNFDDVDINIEKLEQFYINHFEQYQSINEQLRYKNQIILYLIVSTFINSFVKFGKSKVHSYIGMCKETQENFDQIDFGEDANQKVLHK